MGLVSSFLVGRSQGMAPPPRVTEKEEEGKGTAAGHGVVKGPEKIVSFEVEESCTATRPGRLRVVHPDVAQFVWGSRSRSPRLRRARRPKPPPSSPPAVEEEEQGGRLIVRYDCIGFEDEDEDGARGFAAHRLVWGKVKSHPWWPGQVVDPADASEPARRRHRRPGAVLVAFFFDKSFAWIDDAAALRPFRAGFRRFAAQSARHSPFTAAVDAALGEVARRVHAGLSCGCGGDVAGVSERQVVIDNAGVREGAFVEAVDAAFARGAFRGAALVAYVSALAAAPVAGADRVDVAIATAQLRAFSRWRGSTRDLPEYNYFDGIDDGDAMKAAAASARARKRRKSSSGLDGSGASARARKKKMARCGAASGRNDAAACESVVDDDDDDFEVQDAEAFPVPKSTKMGILMNRAARQMSRSPVVLLRRANNGNNNAPPNVAKCTTTSVVADELPAPVNNGAAAAVAKDDHAACKGPPVDEQGAGLVLNFSGAEAVPSANDLTMIFSRFGPVKEASVENASALVIFKRREHAEEAFAGTAKIRAINASLISFRLTYPLPPAATDPLTVEPVL